METEYPSILRRYFSTFIDGLFIIGMLVLWSYILDRDIKKARCKMKVCCIGKGFNSCADCESYDTCEIGQGFYSKKGYKDKKYEEATLFVREKGYSKFLVIADGWKNQYGNYG